MSQLVALSTEETVDQVAGRVIASPGSALVARLRPELCDQPTLHRLYQLARAHRVRLGLRFDDTDTPRVPDASEHLYVNAVEAEISSTEAVDGWESMPELLGRRHWASLTLSGHANGAHLNVGDAYLCGLLGESERYLDGTPVTGGCTGLYCKKAKPHRPAMYFTDLSANVLAMLGCNTMATGTRLYPSDLSLVLAALRSGRFANIVAVTGSFLALQGIELRFIQRLRRGARLGDIVNEINATPMLAAFGTTVILIGDPDYRAGVEIGEPTATGDPTGDPTGASAAAPASPPSGTTTGPAVQRFPDTRPDAGSGGFRAIHNFVVRAIETEESTGSLSTEELDEVIGALARFAAMVDTDATRDLADVGKVLSAVRDLKIEPSYYGLALRPRTARFRMPSRRCWYCGSRTVSWLDEKSGYQEWWCVCCGHLLAGANPPDLSCQVRRTGDEQVTVTLSSAAPLGACSVVIRDECRGRDLAFAAFDTTDAYGTQVVELTAEPSPDTLTVHVLRHADRLYSYRSHMPDLGAGGHPEQAVADVRWETASS